MSIELTQLSANEYERIRLGQMTPAMASEFLREDRIVLRTFQEVLLEMYPHPDLTARLVTAFLSGDSNAQSVTRKVQNWVGGKNAPTRREDVFRMAFALELTESQTNALMGQCTDYGIHYRDGRELVYAWFLRHGRHYEQARRFYGSLPPIPWPEKFPDDCTVHITQQLHEVFFAAQTEEELRACYLANLERMGQPHVRAYDYFERYLNLLVRPSTPWDSPPEMDYSLDAVMEKYLSMKMPSGRKRTNYTTTQKLIKRNWPNTTALKNIRAHREDVPRKLLILLYIITENMVDDVYSELDEEYPSVQDRLEDHWWTINAMLSDCGMPTLDPRNAFDWLVLYSVTATDDESMSERMEKVIEQVFAHLPGDDE